MTDILTLDLGDADAVEPETGSTVIDSLFADLKYCNWDVACSAPTTHLLVCHHCGESVPVCASHVQTVRSGSLVLFDSDTCQHTCLSEFVQSLEFRAEMW